MDANPTTVYDNDEAGDARMIIERDEAGQYYLTTNADTRRPVDANMYRASTPQMLDAMRDEMIAAGIPEPVADEYFRQACLYP